jgi:hypothetical protein
MPQWSMSSAVTGKSRAQSGGSPRSKTKRTRSAVQSWANNFWVLRHGHNGSGIGGFQRTNNFGGKLLASRQNRTRGLRLGAKLKDCVASFTIEAGRRPAEVDSGRASLGLPLGMPASRKMKSEKGGLSRTALYLPTRISAYPA